MKALLAGLFAGVMLTAEPDAVQVVSQLRHWSGQGVAPVYEGFDINADGVVVTQVGAVNSDSDHLVENILLTAYGDANLDRTVNLVDFNTLAANFGLSARDWFQADFNGDDLVNLADFNLLAAYFGFSAGADAVVDPQDWSTLATLVPEPNAALIAGLASGAMLRRRRSSP